MSDPETPGQLPRPDEVERLYWEERLSTRQIGERFGVSRSTVTNYMARHGIETRPPYLKGEENTKYIPIEDLLDDLIAGYIVLEDWPNSAQYTYFGEHCLPTIYRRFDTWEEAIDEAKGRLESIGGVEAWLGADGGSE